MADVLCILLSNGTGDVYCIDGQLTVAAYAVIVIVVISLIISAWVAITSGMIDGQEVDFFVVVSAAFIGFIVSTFIAILTVLIINMLSGGLWLYCVSAIAFSLCCGVIWVIKNVI